MIKQLNYHFIRYLCSMKRLMLILALIVAMVTIPSEEALAQSRRHRVRGASAASWRTDSRGDSTLYITLLPVNIRLDLQTLKQHERMIRAVKKVYPLALEAAMRMENLEEELAARERNKDKKAYTKAIEEALKEELTPMLWKMTRYEGKILLKLLDRETNYTAYNIIKDFRSGFTAGFYQMIAKLFGNNLKLEYDPTGEDRLLEQIVLYYKAGLL